MVETRTAVDVLCSTCGVLFVLSSRNVRRHRRDGSAPRCAICRGLGRLPQPTEADRVFWLDALGLDEARKLAGLIWPEPF